MTYTLPDPFSLASIVTSTFCWTLLSTEYVMELSMSASVALIDPMVDLFSSIVKVSSEVKIGSLSFRLFMVIEISCVITFMPSLTLMVDE